MCVVWHGIEMEKNMRERSRENGLRKGREEGGIQRQSTASIGHLRSESEFSRSFESRERMSLIL